MVDNIVEGLSQVDPKNAAVYRANGAEYKLKLQQLDAKIRDSFTGIENRKILYAGHFAFGYFAHRYDLEHISPYRGFAPNAEPTPQRIAELIRNVQEAGTRVVYYEELVDPRVARVISEQTGAKMVLLHGAHNISLEELNGGFTYLSIMEENLQKLLEGLKNK
jgi:zinc transport system substrate-binding protein